MPDIVNPYIAGNPVTGAEMFFGRDDVFTFVQQALTGQHRDNVIVLYGQRRTGKTSVMYQMHRHLDPRYLCIFIDLHGLALEGLNGFLWELANTISRALHKDYQIDVPRPANRDEFLADARSSFENDFLNQVWATIGDRHVLLMLDEAIRLQEQIQAGKLEKEIFEYLRHLMQHFDRLNFLFSLGSGLEEMEKEYAFLFSVGLYKKISFLEREAAAALITQPAKDCYQVEPAAIDRILQITSGHAYYTQLVCHSLFNRWQQDHQSLMTAKDVDAILDEVVERGLAVLKHVWEDSTPSEKAVLAGLATAMGERNRPIGPQEINRAWKQQDVILPDSERAKAIKSLIARDVIVGQDRYEFAVDLQRIYLLRYERLEWVKEEIAPALREWKAIAAPVRSIPQKRQKTVATPVRSFLPRQRWLVTVVTVIVAGLCVTSSFIYPRVCGTLGTNLPLCPASAKPVINLFAAAPDELEKGGTIILTWDVSNAEKVELIAPVQETLEKIGVKTVNVEQSTNFTLKATNFAGSVEKSITVKVIGNPPIVPSPVLTPGGTQVATDATRLPPFEPAPSKVLTCTLYAETTSALQNTSFATAVDLPGAIYGLALFNGNPGDTVVVSKNYFRLTNPIPNYIYSVQVTPDSRGNYNLGIVVYDAAQHPIKGDQDPLDDRGAWITIIPTTTSTLYFEVSQLVPFGSHSCGGTYYLFTSLSAPTRTPIGTSTPPPKRTPTRTP